MKFFGNIIKNKGWVGKKYSLEDEKFDLLSLYSLNQQRYPYLLESSSRGNKKNRFSILFYKPIVKIKKTGSSNKNFLNSFDDLWKKQNIKQDELYFEKKRSHFVVDGLYI